VVRVRGEFHGGLVLARRGVAGAILAAAIVSTIDSVETLQKVVLTCGNGHNVKVSTSNGVLTHPPPDPHTQREEDGR
jgi:hypothetical protein